MNACRIESFLNVCSASNPVYDPDGQKLCYIADYTGLPQIWELNRGERLPKQITFILRGDVDIIVIDPEREYGDLFRAINGEVIHISAGSKNHINAIRMRR